MRERRKVVHYGFALELNGILDLHVFIVLWLHVPFITKKKWIKKGMLLTITTTYQPATDLGYLLHKNPAHAQSFDLAFGQAHVLYPEATVERCTAVLLLDINPVGLVRREGSNHFALEQYVNDRPYTA